MGYSALKIAARMYLDLLRETGFILNNILPPLKCRGGR